ncbi:MAG: hypothetical protein HKN21_06895, partial [Candidatus Eisenbacteria bacterium]|nr:hypothetical protein [Candidatus Eisenbacteria bacterium]
MMRAVAWVLVHALLLAVVVPCSTLAQPEWSSNQKTAPEEKPKLDPEQWG